MLLIQASNIHNGGGATLLRPLLQADFADSRFAWVDERFDMPERLAVDVDVEVVRPSIISRLRTDVNIARKAKPNDILLCLGNLPPINRAPCKTIVYLQNRYLIDKVSLNNMPIYQRLRLTIERLWFRTFISHAQTYLVQTPSMRLILLENFNLAESQVKLAPYLPLNATWPRTLLPVDRKATQDQRPFLYVASGEPHKNHLKLVEAWIMLAKQGYFPKLQLTIKRQYYPDLVLWIEEQTCTYGLQLEIDAKNEFNSIDDLYKKAQALIFPSRFESLGLPLIEARQAGLPVLAPELDYVRDVLDPDEVFNPDSARSIASAVKRFMGLAEPSLFANNAMNFMELLKSDRV
jgi:glycosyltransferase involved in cell wall biosynthesis